ncbi:hypothetical protein BJ986_003178 [Phycicoccus badiiscoriae]|uniref:TetR family transcriptional regulator n=1 Tax=Pedococcus badiiscoriae TaxID=642776 RepID=A0A852WM87_9MICO|nr:hypothetical protein [Pedococcus badiiscoriae]NYG08691.1 hypothetical protein [Pedococcus badiiscoriae]
MRALWDRALAGEGDEPAEQRSDAVAVALAATEPREVVAHWARLTAEVGPRAAPLLALVRTAAQLDPEAAALWAEINRGRAQRMTHNAAILEAGGHLRPGVSVAQARDVLLLYSTLYEPLVMEAGWSLEQLVDFTERGLVAHLLVATDPRT